VLSSRSLVSSVKSESEAYQVRGSMDWRTRLCFFTFRVDSSWPDDSSSRQAQVDVMLIAI
jgi:hypothetical protein